MHLVRHQAHCFASSYFILYRTNAKKSIQSLKKKLNQNEESMVLWQQINLHVCLMPTQYLCLAN